MIRSTLRFLRVFIRVLLGPPAPRIFVVSPIGGWPGSFITIDGSGFSPNLDDSAVEIGGAPALIVRAATDQLQVIVGETAVSGPVRVTVDGITATAATLFERLPWPDVNEGIDGPPKFFHGPQHGTPTLGVQNQRVAVLLCAPTDDKPVDPSAEWRAEHDGFGAADRFWREATYQRTSFQFEVAWWLDLPKERGFYIW